MDTEEQKQKWTKHKQTKYRQIKKKDTTSNKQSREGQTQKDTSFGHSILKRLKKI